MRPAFTALALLVISLWPCPGLSEVHSSDQLIKLAEEGNTPAFCREVGPFLSANAGDPRYAELLFLSAECTDQALARIAIYHEVIRLDPNGESGSRASIAIAELSYLLADYDAAIEAGSRLVERFSESEQARQARWVLLRSLLSRGDTERAEKVLHEILDGAKPEDASVNPARVELARIRFDAGDYDAALELCWDVIKSEDLDSMPSALLLAGSIHIRLGENGAASRLLRATLVFKGGPQARRAEELLDSSIVQDPTSLPVPANERFAITIDKFKDEASASDAVERINGLGYRARLVQGSSGPQVRVGDFNAEVDAFLALRRIERELGLKGRSIRVR